MTTELLNFYLFAQLLLKAGMMTGLLPGILGAVVYEVFFGSRLAKVIPFPRKPLGPEPGRRADRIWRKVA